MRRRHRRGGLYFNPQSPRKLKLSREQRKVFNALRKKRDAIYKAGDHLSDQMNRLMRQVRDAQEKENETVVEIGCRSKKPTKVTVGGIDLLKLVDRVSKIEAEHAAMLRGINKLLRK